MRTWTSLNQKGGCGKTTVLLNLSAAALADDKTVTIIDLDPQASAQGWSNRRDQRTPLTEPVVVPGLPDALEQMLAAAARDATDLVLIDTSPRLDKAMLYAAAQADLVIVPTRSSSLDQDALRDTLKYLEMAQALHKVVVVFNAFNADAAARKVTDKLVADFRVVRLKSELPDLVGLATAIDKGRGAVEIARRGKAAEAVEAVYRDLLALDRKRAKTLGVSAS
jgi:chromosome partitioning protein